MTMNTNAYSRRRVLGWLAAATLLVLGSGAIPSLAVAGPPAATTATAPSPNSPEFPRYIMARVDDMYRGQKSHGTMRMEVKTKHWTRSMLLESWSLGEDYSLVRILEPKKERGTATLKTNDDLFTYLNKTGRTIKITSGMMGGAWMGSHFSNDDLVKSSRLSDDYDIRTTFAGDRGGESVYEFTLTPKPNAPVVWGKIVVAIRQADLVPLEQAFFDEDGQKTRVLTFSGYREVQGRPVAMHMEMKPLDKPGEYTKISFDDIDFAADIDKSFFTLQKLKSLR